MNAKTQINGTRGWRHHVATPPRRWCGEAPFPYEQAIPSILEDRQKLVCALLQLLIERVPCILRATPAQYSITLRISLLTTLTIKF